MNVVLEINDFKGGEASVFPFYKMPPWFGCKLQNCHITESGGMGKIPGYARVNLTSVNNPLTNGFEFRKSDGTVIKLCAGGGSIYKLVGNELTVIKNGLNAGAKVWFEQINDLCLMGNGVDTPMKFDGANVTNLGGLPANTKFRKPHVFRGRVWWTDATNNMMAYHSALNAAEDYTTASNAGYIDFRFILGKGEELIDIATFVDLQVFFFRNHVVIYSGSNPTSSGDYNLVQKIQGVGAVTTGAAISVGTDMYFIHDSGVKSLKQVVTTGSMTVGDVSELESSAIQRELAATNVVSCAHYPRRGWVFFLIEEVVWIYDYNRKAWGRMVGADVKGMFNLSDGSAYLTGTGFLYNYGQSWGFDTNTIPVVWEGPWCKFTAKGHIAYPKIMEIVCGKGIMADMAMNLRFDLGGVQDENSFNFTTSIGESFMDEMPADTWETSIFMDSPYTFEIIRVPVYGGGRSMQVIMFNNSDKGPLEWNNIIVKGVLGRTI